MKFDALSALAAIVLAVSLAPAATAADITGAGATFPYPVYAKWAEAYKAKTGVGLNYQSIGSGGGISRSRPRPWVFGATDAPLKFDELEKDGLIQFPMVMGGVVPVVNVAGQSNPARCVDCPGRCLPDIYLGKSVNGTIPQSWR
jgi:phosphate transport system substrate-binding protein